MLCFLSDYTEGAHPKVLAHLMERNLVSLPGYGEDADTEAAKEKIRRECGRDDLQICFLTGGTQTNRIAISSMLKSYEGVVCCETGHIAVHESGAIESSGHKVIALPGHDGKLRAEDLAALMEGYLLAETCKKYGLPLYLDGARLGYGLTSPLSELTLRDIVELTDLFYIGGTKVGALCGEALIYTKHNMPPHFMAIIKQQGALLAKTRVVSQQFDALFTDGLYWEVGSHAIGLAMRMKEMFRAKGYELYIDSPTNQQFFILTWEQIERLRQYAAFEIWARLDEHRAAVRFVTSWATTEQQLDELESVL